MKKLILFVPVLAMLIFTTSCNKENPESKTDVVQQYIPSTLNIDLPESPFNYPLSVEASVNSRSSETTDIYYFQSGLIADGSSKLTRNANGVTVNFKADNLDPSIAGHAVTMWWVIWDDYPCCFIDAGYANGKVIGNNGKVNISAHLNEGDLEGFFYGNGLQDAENNEIHLIVRSHNTKDSEYMPAQINSFCGGCWNADCAAGPYTCLDFLFSIHDPE